MRKIIAILLFCAVGLSANAQRRSAHNDYNYEPTTVITGERNERGEKTGEWKSYYKNGQVCTIENYTFIARLVRILKLKKWLEKFPATLRST